MASKSSRLRLAATRFKKLLASKKDEQAYQDFLERNTEFVPREFVQNHGVHFGLLLRKLSMARDYTTDFFFLSKSSSDWNGVLIEIEKPQSRYFKDNSNVFHNDFVKAQQQIGRWRAWFSSPENQTGFFNKTLEHVRVPAHMRANPCHIKYVLVFGRREEFETNPTRVSLVHAEERDDFKIVSYDSLLEDFGSKSRLYLGVRKNEFIDIISDEFLREDMFAWMDPTSIRVSESFKADALAKRADWFHHGVDADGTNYLQMERALPKVRVRSG